MVNVRCSVVLALLLVSGPVAAADDLAGQWQVSGRTDGQTYSGTATIEPQGGGLSLAWDVGGARRETLTGRVEAGQDSFYLFSTLGLRARIARFFTRRRTVKYRGTLQRVSADELRVALSAGGQPAGEEVWTRVAAPAPSPSPSPSPTQPDPLPGPNDLPFIHPDAFVPLPGTDVWYVEFAPGKFREDMRRRGLLSGDPATDEAMLLRLESLVLQGVNQKYRRTHRGEAVAGQSWKISFTARPPRADARVFPGVSAPRVGVDYSRMEVGGTDGGTHGRVPRNDTGNRRREDNSGSQYGVFAGSIQGSHSTLDPALTAADRRYVDGSYALGDGDTAADRRFMEVQEVSADWAYALSSTLAHEVGHSVGCPHTGKTFWGHVVRAGPRLSLMRHKKDRSILSARDTRFFSPNQGRLDGSLGIER